MKTFIFCIFLLPMVLIAQGSSTVKDVFNHQIDLDSIIIVYAGRMGIPPQLIKAQIHVESLFKPAMRYEPFLDMQYQTDPNWTDSIKNNQYWIDSTSNGSPASPSNHTFWYFGKWNTTYPGYIGSIFDAWNNHQGTYPRDLYSSLQKVYNTALYSPALTKTIKQYPKWSEAQQESYADSLAEANWPNYLRDKYKGGLKNYPAQTRIMSSYGFLQMIYFYALTDRGYPEDDAHLPEVLMVTDTSFTYSTRHLLAMFENRKIQEKYSNNTGWKAGYDKTWYKALACYNGAYNTKYADAVFNYMKNYLPQNK